MKGLKMKRSLNLLWLILFMSITTNVVLGQEFIEKITSIFEFDVGKNRHTLDSNAFVARMVISPVASYEPSTSLGFGIGAKLLFKPGNAGLDTRTSNMPMSITYTLKNQFIIYSGYTVFFDQENYLLKGKLTYSDFPVSYYGIGSTSTDDDKQEIGFNNFLLEPLLLKKIAPSTFIGGGIRFNNIYNARLEESWLDLHEGTSLQDVLGSTSFGLELAFTFDNRDNVLNALNGSLLEVTHGFYDDVLVGTHEFQLTKLDYRSYLQFQEKSLNVLALQAYARFAWYDTPPLELSSLGGPEILRGFQEDRFRDRMAIFAQAEYRWQTFERLGFVFYGGIGEVFNEVNDLQFQNLKYSLGSGLRVKIVQSENLNIRLDYALGLGPIKDHNFYLGIAEAF